MPLVKETPFGNSGMVIGGTMFYVDTILLIIIAMGLLIGLRMLATVSLLSQNLSHTRQSDYGIRGSTGRPPEDMYVKTYK